MPNMPQNSAVVDQLYDELIDKLYNLALYKTGDRQIAQDFAEESFLRFINSDSQISNPKAYLYQICRNLIADYFRSGHKPYSLDKLMELGFDPPDHSDSTSSAEISQVLETIAHLPEDQRDVLLLHYVQDLDIKTISKIMNKSESAVKSLAYRGLESLRCKLNPKI